MTETLILTNSNTVLPSGDWERREEILEEYFEIFSPTRGPEVPMAVRSSSLFQKEMK